MYFFPVQGKIPKNNFGNIDLYVPSMLPEGAVHIPCESPSFQPPKTHVRARLLLQSKALQNSLVNLDLISRKQLYVTHSSNPEKAKTYLLKTGFEFKKRRAFPILEGVVVAQENEAMLLEVRLTFLPFSFVCFNKTTPNRHIGKRRKKRREKPRSNATSASLNIGRGSYRVCGSGSG